MASVYAVSRARRRVPVIASLHKRFRHKRRYTYSTYIVRLRGD